MKPIDYRAKYLKYHASPEAVAARQARNAARRTMRKLGLVHVGDGKIVAHLDNDPFNKDFNQKAVMYASQVDTWKGRKR